MVVKTINEFDQLKSQWDELLGKFNPMPLPLSHAWLRSWWIAFFADMEMEFRCLYRNKVLVGVAPLLNVDVRYRGLIPITVMKLSVNGHTPFSNIILDPGLTEHERNYAFVILTHVDKGKIGSFRKIQKHSELWYFLKDKKRSGFVLTGEKSSLLTPVININMDWIDFYNGRSRNLRKNLKHKLNRFYKSNLFTVCQKDITSAESPVFDDIVKVSANSWKSAVSNDLRSNQRSLLFLKHLVRDFEFRGFLKVWLVYHGCKPVAYELHLVFDSIVYPLRADYDSAYRAYSPGSVLEYTALKRLFESHSARQYYTCADDYWYLSNWTTDYVQYCDLEVYGKGIRLFTLYFLEYKIIPLIKNMIKGCKIALSVLVNCGRRDAS